LKDIARIGGFPWSKWETAGVTQIVNKQPAVDVVPRKRARWKSHRHGKELRCTNCDWSTEFNIPRNFCPNCGAMIVGGGK